MSPLESDASFPAPIQDPRPGRGLSPQLGLQGPEDLEVWSPWRILNPGPSFLPRALLASRCCHPSAHDTYCPPTLRTSCDHRSQAPRAPTLVPVALVADVTRCPAGSQEPGFSQQPPLLPLAQLPRGTAVDDFAGDTGTRTQDFVLARQLLALLSYNPSLWGELLKAFP